MVEHPREGIYTYGFLTGDVRVEGVEPKRLVSVFVPTNHLYLGDILLVPPRAVVPTGLTIEEGIRIILSGGTAAPRWIAGTPSAAEPGPVPRPVLESRASQPEERHP